MAGFKSKSAFLTGRTQTAAVREYFALLWDSV
jgi:hypothetical protein